MKDIFNENLLKYAELVTKVGVNIQKNQFVFISASTEVVHLAREIARFAYVQGAKQVFVDFVDDEITRMRYELADVASFDFFPSWKIAEREQLVEHGAAFISIVSQSPDLLNGIDPQKIAVAQKAAGQALSKFRQAVQSDKIAWTVIGGASKAWAAKVFPELSKEEQVPALWDAIFKAARVTFDDPITEWERHNNTLKEKVNFLNDKKFVKLHYTAAGTDLIVELPEGHIWCGGNSKNIDGTTFNANMPTEEVFTAPARNGVNGHVSSTKPLSYGGNIIDNFVLTFENGKIVNVKAEQGEDVLKNLIATDEGSHYLGEVALVPHDSPISNSNILYYSTLFDENASNHFAIGSAYSFCLEGGKEMSQEELLAHGLNTSLTHVDFMIGAADMNINGVLADGTSTPIFRNGNWAF